MLYMMRYDSPIGPLLLVEKEGALAGNIISASCRRKHRGRGKSMRIQKC